MAHAGFQVYDVVAAVGGFHADHDMIFIVAELTDEFGFFHPGVPYDRCFGAALFHENLPVEHGVDDRNRGIRCVNIVRFGGETEVTFAETAGNVSTACAVAVGGAAEPGDRDLFDLPDGEVGVECAAEGLGAVPLIDRDQFHGKFCAEVDFKNGVETMRFVNGKAEYDRIGTVALFPDSRHVPVLNARNAVHRFCRRSEPRPADGHSAANRFRRLVCAEFRHHDQVLFPVRDIGEDMCAVGRYRAFAVLIGNKCRRQGGIFPCTEGNAFRFEFSVEFRDQICRIHLVFRLSVLIVAGTYAINLSEIKPFPRLSLEKPRLCNIVHAYDTQE